MENHNLQLLENKDLLIICPTRIRPEQAKTMYNSFRNTSTYNAEIIFYIADDDPMLDKYKYELRYCAYIIDKRRTIIQVANHISCELYPDRKYYAFIGDDNRYKTKGWDNRFIKEIENKGRGWGIAYGNDLFQKSNLAGNPIISSNIIKALGYMSLPVLQHQYVDNFWTDMAISINRLYYCDDIIVEHLHPFAKKGQMDDNYKWIYQSGVTEKDKVSYESWLKSGFPQDRTKFGRAMMRDYRSRPDYKTIGLSIICADSEKPEVLRRALQSAVDYIDSINIVFNYKGFPKKWRLKKLVKVLEEFKDAYYKYVKWTDFSQVKNLSLEMNENSYIFVCDCDDVVPIPILLHDVIYHKPEVDCFKCQVHSDTPNRGKELILQNRLFKNNPKFRFRNLIHEDISYSMLEQNAQVIITDIIIHHLGNIDEKRFKAKNQRNYKLLMREIKSGKAHVLTYFHLINTLMIFNTKRTLQQALKHIDYSLGNFNLKPEDPIVPKLKILRGLCCLNLHALTKDIRLRDTALSDFLASYGLKEGSEAAVNIAEIYMQQQKWDDTIKLLEKHLNEFETQKIANMPFDYKNIYLLILFKLGDCYSAKQDWVQAERYYREFVEINPYNLEAVDRLCQVLRNLGNWNTANFLTAKAVNIWPGYYVGWRQLGDFEIQQKRYTTGRMFLQKALSIKPDYEEARHNLIMLRKIKGGVKWQWAKGDN